jgi:hypothetical protein
MHETGCNAVLGFGVACLRERQPYGNGGLVGLCGEERLSLAKLIRNRWHGRGLVAAERETEQLHGSASAS